MNCAVCGKDNQPGTRFCVHCGAALAAPRPAAGAPAVTAAATVVRPAAAPPPPPLPPPAPPIPSDTVVRAAAPPLDTAAAPAYDVNPGVGGGRVLLAIGLAALVIAAGFVGYKIFGGSAEVKDSFAKFDSPATPRETPPPPAARPAEPASQPPPESAKVEEKPTTPPPEAMKSEAPKTDALKAPADVEKAKGPPPVKTDAKAPAKTPSTTPPVAASAAPAIPPAARAPAPAPVPVAPAAAPPVQDRWAQMAAEQQQCKTENLFNRVICDQKVRLRYCKDYWGTVPQCPGAVANPDRGQ